MQVQCLKQGTQGWCSGQPRDRAGRWAGGGFRMGGHTTPTFARSTHVDVQQKPSTALELSSNLNKLIKKKKPHK